MWPIECDRTTEDFPALTWASSVTFVNDLGRIVKLYLLQDIPRGSGTQKLPVFPGGVIPNVNSGISAGKLGDSS